MHEGGAFALLHEFGPQILWKKGTILDETDEDWERKYFHVGWREKILNYVKIQKSNLQQTVTVNHRGEKIVTNNTNANLWEMQLAWESPTFVVYHLVPKMKNMVRKILWECILNGVSMDNALYATGSDDDPNNVSYYSDGNNKKELDLMDESMVIDWFRALIDIVTRVFEKEMLAPWFINLKRPQFIFELSALIRVAAYEKRKMEELTVQEEALKILVEQKQQIEDHFLLIIKANSNDVDVAQDFAKRYHENIKKYIG